MSATPFSPLRVTILLGHRLEDPLPEAVELAKAAALDFQRSGLAIEIRVDLATTKSLQREANRGCDLFVFYGHGSEDGRLTFVDDRFGFADLSAAPELERFWQSLAGCFVFACYGDRFATSLPCPWVAFREPILKTAPKGFVHAFVAGLRGGDLAAAIVGARERCRHEMESSFVDVFEISEAPWWSRGVALGEPQITRGSPALTGLYDIDFGSVELDGYIYPDHDPFVGRVGDLRSLLRIPSCYGDVRLQRAVWVHGDPGMGKSALLRELATLVRDADFRDESEPTHLLHRYCFNFTRPQQLVEAVCDGGAKLYGLADRPASVEDLVRAIEGRVGVHVWLLDDLTYLAIRPDQQEEALRVVRAILGAAQTHALPLLMVVSSRRKPVWEHEALEVGALALDEAVALAAQVVRRGPGVPTTPVDVARLFVVVGRSTATFKRSLLLAAAQHVNVGEYADAIREGDSLEAGEQREPSLRALRYELEALGALEVAHGFAYRRFLGILYRLIKRAAHFTVSELVEWFGDDLRSEAEARSPMLAYRGGVAYLTRIGFLLARPGDGERSFTLPPNQRWGAETLEEAALLLPSRVPLRGVSERLSLAVERASLGDLSAVGELVEMEHDYLGDLPDPSATRAVFYSRILRAELVPNAALPLYDAIERTWDQYGTALRGSEAEEPFVQALINKGAKLAELGRAEEAIVVYDAALARFTDRSETFVAEGVANALYNKALVLGRIGRLEEEIAVYDEVVRRFADRPEADFAEKVARALVNTRARLSQLGQLEEAIVVNDDIVRRFANRPEAALAEKGANALFIKAMRLGQLGRAEEEIAVYDEVVRQFANRPEAPLAEKVANALSTKGERLAQLGREEEAIAVFDDIALRFADRPEMPFAESVAEALFHRAAALVLAGQREDALAAIDVVLHRYGARAEPELAAVTAKAVEVRCLIEQSAAKNVES